MVDADPAGWRYSGRNTADGHRFATALAGVIRAAIHLAAVALAGWRCMPRLSASST
jgi:hypothetical protein